MFATGSGSTLIAWWGAGLSTLLAIVKLLELWRDRFRVEAATNSLDVKALAMKLLSATSQIAHSSSRTGSSSIVPVVGRKELSSPLKALTSIPVTAD